ncbi:hypothetical protein DL93DRAFT_2081708, partial [Clavulina sp. PMI_390]
MEEKLQALVRLPQRASYVRSLSISLTSSVTHPPLLLGSCLEAVPNLQCLSVTVPTNDKLHTILTHRLCIILSNCSPLFRFRLDEFECDAQAITSSALPGMFPFLTSQPTIRRLSVRRMRVFESFWCAPLPQRLEESGCSTGNPLLPSLECYMGPSSFAALFLHGLEKALSVEVYASDIAIDSKTDSSHNLPPETVVTHSFSIWGDNPYDEVEDDIPSPIETTRFIFEQVTRILPSAYIIDMRSLYTLRIGLARPINILSSPNHTILFPSIYSLIESLPSLERLELPNTHFLGGQEFYRAITGAASNSGPWQMLPELVQGCERRAPKLRHMVLADRARPGFM